MQRLLMLLSLYLISEQLYAQTVGYNSYPVYAGQDLGLTRRGDVYQFRIWAPTADAVQLLFYTKGDTGEATDNLPMKKAEGGTWLAQSSKATPGLFYAFRVRIGSTWLDPVPDPYAKSVGVNGKRACIVDLSATNPDGWFYDFMPAFGKATDAIIYELHIRDASISPSSGIRQKGKYKGLAETGTKNAAGLSTGLDHISEMGVTHIHLLPFFDYLSVDERYPDSTQYNWGYEPLNYNVPEGSYASEATDGITRIRELKEMIQAMHKKGLRVVMDVVYNHTMLTQKSLFNQLVPGYYYRHLPDGSFSDATACGNEMASERTMVRKFMIESLEYWVNEFHIDGFRFDLMGVHDIETMNQIAYRLRTIKPGILLYGEGWTAGASPLPEKMRAVKKQAGELYDVAVFSDDIRDAIKGSVFRNEEKGFVSGQAGLENSIRFGVVAACEHPQIDYSRVNYSKAPYAASPLQTVSYAECHDNHVLWDKLALSASTVTEAERRKMHQLALSIVLTSQGISFLHAGTEFLRSKQGNENSYNAGDRINAIDWNLKTQNEDVVRYVQALITLRKKHPAFRLKTGEQVKNLIHFLDTAPGIVAYTIDSKKAGDRWKKIAVVYNANESNATLNLSKGKWQHHMLPGQQEIKMQAGSVSVPGRSSAVFFVK
ncbi:MAG: type I pullulanase [Chitinophagaceae bacterium]|nr:type I pullulanase [Chitinophagaceae bacterium]